MNVLLTTLNAKYIHSNLALKYLSTSCNIKLEQQISIGKMHLTVQEYTINNLQDYILVDLQDRNLDVICFSCYIWNIEMIKDICKTYHKANPNTVLVFGGPEVSYDAQAFLAENEFASFVLVGEGECSLPTLLQNMMNKNDDFSTVPSLFYRTMGHSIAQTAISPVLSFDDIPFVYNEENIPKDKIVYYESARGCPYRCAYCISSLDKTLRFMDESTVKEHMNFFNRMHVKQVKFIDRTFNANQKRAYHIWEYIIEHCSDMNFHFEICADLINDETMQLLRRAPKDLFQFEIGIQTTNLQTLEAINRKTDLDKVFRRIAELQACHNIHIHVDLIAGLPYESYVGFANSFNQVYALQPDALQLGFLKLLKGVEIREEAHKHGYVHRDKAPYEVIANHYISASELCKLKKIEDLLSAYYNKQGYRNTVAAMIAHSGLPAFDFYEKLSDFYYRRGYQHRSHRKEDKYRILYDFITCCGQYESNCEEIIKQILNDDLVTHMNFDAVKMFHRQGWMMKSI